MPFEYGQELYMEAIKAETEERLYQYWVAYANNPFGGPKRKSWEEFSSTANKKSPPTTKTSGNYSGDDLVAYQKRK